MAQSNWYRDPKFNPRLRSDGSLNFNGFLKRVTVQPDPLAEIIRGLERELDRTSSSENKLYLDRMIYGRSVIPGMQAATCLNLRLEKPLPLNKAQYYHGYELVKISSGQVVVRRLLETKTKDTWSMRAFGDEYKCQDQQLKELFKLVDYGRLRKKDSVTDEVARILYKIWP